MKYLKNYYKIFCKNEDEFIDIQKILFKSGYKWSDNDTKIFNFSNFKGVVETHNGKDKLFSYELRDRGKYDIDYIIFKNFLLFIEEMNEIFK